MADRGVATGKGFPSPSLPFRGRIRTSVQYKLAVLNFHTKNQLDPFVDA